MQAVLKANAGPGFSLRDVPEPTPGPGQILLRVVAASVCGTDVHLYDWNPWAASRMHPPQIVGHELCGEVIAHGEDATNAGAVTTTSAPRPKSSASTWMAVSHHM
jgi:threonine 3-dehydrogenase